MRGGSENAAGEKDGRPTLTAQVPVGWQRKVEDGAVAYVSPSGTVLRSVEEVRVYLLTDSTCKCGLECPLVLHKVFNFDPAAVVHDPSHQSGKVEEDMTKLCNHRRKVVAMAALCRSMQTSQIPLSNHGTGDVVCPVDGKDQRGPIVARGDIVHCTYLTQPRLNQPRPSSSSSFPLPSPLSLLQNGSVSQPMSVLTSDQSSPVKRPPVQSTGPGITAYGKQQWSPHPAITQTILQRAPHKPPSPSTTKLDTHLHAYQLDSSLPVSFSSPPSSSSPAIGRTGQPHLQGMIVKSPSHLSVSSPSHILDSFSPHQRSRHSSTSSLSEGAPGSVLSQAHGVKLSPSPLPSTQPSASSPKVPLPLASPRIRLEGILQQFKECSTTSTNTNINSIQHHNTLTNQSHHHTLQNPQPTHSTPSDRRTSSASAPGILGLPLGQILCQQKNQQQHISSSFPASSLLSAAAKAQLASQKSQNLSGATEATAALPLLDKDQQSKVLISTLNSSLQAPTARSQSLTAFLLPHSPSLPMTPPILTEKKLHRKRQRRSPTVLSMLKESQMNQTTGDPPASSMLVPSPSSSCSPPPSILHSDNHLQNPRLSVVPPASSSNMLKQPEWEEGKKTIVANSLPLSSPPSSSQPLSALLQLFSMQSSQNTVQSSSTTTSVGSSKHTIVLPPSSPSSVYPHAPNYDSHSGPRTHVHMHQCRPQSLVSPLDSLAQLLTPQPIPLMCEDTEGAAINLKTTAETAVLNLSQQQADTNAETEPSISSQTLSEMSQPLSDCCLRVSTHPEKTLVSKPGESSSDHNIYQANQPNQLSHNQDTESHGPVQSEELCDPENRHLAGSDPDSSVTHTPSTSAPSTDLPNSPSDPASALQLAESFPFMTQEQLLQLLSSTAGLPSLLPPFVGSLPLGLWTGTQPPSTGNSTQLPPPTTNNLLNQTSPLSILPSTLGTQGEFPLNLISLLNPPAPASPAPTAPLAPAPGLESVEKTPGLQALLMASLLLGQNPAALLPLPGLNLELPPLQQVFGEGVSLEKTSGPLLDSVLMGPGLLEALQALTSPTDGQSLLLSAQLTPPPPPPPAFLSLNPSLLAAALAQAETLPNHTPSPPPHTQGTLSSPALVSTSVSCTPLVPVSGQEVCDSLTEQEKTSSQTPPFLPPLLPPGVLGDLTALGNINSLHGLLGAGPLLLPQAPSLGVPLPQNQAGLNPLTCLQLSMTPALMGEKPLALHETPPAQEDISPSQLAQDSLLNPGHVQASDQQRAETAGVTEHGLLDPYTSFMDTIYTSFLQVSGRSSEGGNDSTPLSYPELPPILQQPSAPPSLSPRRACSVHNPDLSRLSMETAQSPARGTPKLSEDPSTPPPSKPAGADSCSADAPLHLNFMEEAKTDGSAKPCVYSNGIGSGAGAGRENNEDEEEEERQPQGYQSPRERVTSDAVDDACNTEQSRAIEIRTGAKRGRKRKQTLQRGSDVPGDIERIIEEPAANIALPRPARAARGKRRRIVR